MSWKLLGGLATLTVAAGVVGAALGLRGVFGSVGALAALGVVVAGTLAVVAVGVAARPVRENPYW